MSRGAALRRGTAVAPARLKSWKSPLLIFAGVFVFIPKKHNFSLYCNTIYIFCVSAREPAVAACIRLYLQETQHLRHAGDVGSRTKCSTQPTTCFGAVLSSRGLRRDGVGGLGGDEAVADAELGEQHARLGRVCFDLLADLADEDARVMGIVEVRRAPDFLEQELVGDLVARVLRQYLKEPVFLRREHDARALDGDNAGSKIDGKGTDLDHRLARRGTGVTAQRRVCAREQLRHAERLDHVIVGTILKQAHLLRLVRAH